MPKRAATEIARGKPKAAKTAAGKDRCDLCYQSHYARQMLFVNGRMRHSFCWPALRKIVWERTFYTVKGKQYVEINQPDGEDWKLVRIQRRFGEVKVDYSYHDQRCKKIFELMNKEWMMKQVNCTSKAVRVELIQTAGASQYVNVALALVSSAQVQQRP